MNTVVQSPWWYRQRALVIGLIFLAGFFGAALYSIVTDTPYVPAAQMLHAQSLVLELVAASWLLRVWGSSYLSSATVWSANSITGALVTGGPFAYTRNPLYLGNVLLALGIGALAPAWGWLFINIANMAFTVMLIRWEERGMRERYGEAFAGYCAHVPQLFPRITPGAHSTAHPALREGLRAEIFTAALLAGTIAVVADPSYGWIAFGVLYAFGITTQTVLARQRASV